jgi:hypothetical protein
VVGERLTRQLATARRTRRAATWRAPRRRGRDLVDQLEELIHAADAADAAAPPARRRCDAARPRCA